MAMALGTTPEEEHGPGLAPLARVRYNFTIDHTVKAHFSIVQKIKGQVGLLFVDTEPQEVTEWFEDFHQLDFTQSGYRASRTMIPPRRLSHATPIQPAGTVSAQRRAAAARARSDDGQAERVCRLWRVRKAVWTGKVLTTEQAQLLKLIREKTAVFRVGLRARWGWAERRSGSRPHRRLCCHR